MHVRLLRPAVLAALALATLPSFAQAAAPAARPADDTPPELSACLDKAGSTTAIVSCYGAQHDRDDVRLNADYKRLQTKLEPARRDALRDVQRRWIAFRDADCALAGRATGGTIDRIAGAACLQKHTQRRARDLRDMLGDD